MCKTNSGCARKRLFSYTRPNAPVFFKDVTATKLAGKQFAAFAAAALYYIAAVGSAHPFTETMLFFTLAFFWLVSTLHNYSPLLNLQKHYKNAL